MLKPEAWREIATALAARLAPAPMVDRITLSYEEIETAPDMEITFDPDRELVEIEVRRG